MDQQSPATRMSLLTRLKNAADHEAWAEFTAIYQPLVLRLLDQMGLQEADARDVCQQVLAAVAKDIERWRPDGRERSFRRWLFQIARNRVLKFLESQRRSQCGGGGSGAQAALEQAPEPRESLSDVFEREYRQQLLVTASEAIRPEFHESTWKAFWLSAVEGQPIAEVAEQLGMSVGNVYVARSRIVSRLKNKVREITGEED
jgi:RNA polymerase sigma-70 factor (ECF subfamily)